MRSNRLLSREQAARLDLSARIKLEAQITDSKAAKLAAKAFPPKGHFRDYSDVTPHRRFLFGFLGSVERRCVLDLGCGYHPTPIYLALAGAARVYACDVSTNALAFVQKMAEAAGVADRVLTVLCAAEQLPFRSEEIHLIHGEGVLHHLDLDLAGKELARVLKPGGRAGFKDPLGENPLLEFVRDHVHSRRERPKVTDRPLKFDDIRKFGQHFRRLDFRAFRLLGSFTDLLGLQSNSKVAKPVHWLDDRLVDRLPWMRRLCRYVVTCVEK